MRKQYLPERINLNRSMNVHQGLNGRTMPAVPAFSNNLDKTHGSDNIKSLYNSRIDIKQSGNVVQGYFYYKNRELKSDEIDMVNNFLSSYNNSLVKDFLKGAKSNKYISTLPEWLKKNGISQTVKSILEQDNIQDDDDDNISVFSDFEEDNLTKWEGLKKEKYNDKKHKTQFGLFEEIRDTLKEKKDDLKQNDLLELFGNLNSKNKAYNQSTFGFARKTDTERNNPDDRLFGSKLTTVPLKYLGKTLTNKESFDWYDSRSSKKNEHHFEHGLGEKMEEKGKNLKDYEIMISRERCEHCFDDEIVNKFGQIHDKYEKIEE